MRRWLPYESFVDVRPSPSGGVQVRPRRMSHWKGASVGTSLAAGVVASAAIAQAQFVGYPPLWSFVLAALVSVGVATVLAREIRNHPERWRFLGWWAGFLFAKIVFSSGGLIAVLPFELLALVPALRAAKRASVVKELEMKRSDLAGADVAYLHFKNADFFEADLTNATFSDVVFEGCRFNYAVGEGAQFVRCKFLWCQFQDARLALSRWQHCDARSTLFMRADLRDAEFDAVDLRDSDFENADFRGAKFQELEMVRTRLHATRLAGVRYNVRTVWSPDASPVQAGAVRVDE